MTPVFMLFLGFVLGIFVMALMSMAKQCDTHREDDDNAS